MDLHAIPRLNRLKTILLTLIKYGFEDLVSRLDLPEKLLKKFTSSEQGYYTEEGTWRRMRYVLEELGPTFVKLGQVLSLRSDLIPPEAAEEFKHLQNEVPPEDFDKINDLLTTELETPTERLFSEFDEQPLASASLAQVHRGVLKDGGQVVAVKVQRPGIEKKIRYDLELLALLAEEVHTHVEDLQVYNLPALVDELSGMMRKELDFTWEARNLRSARRNAGREAGLYVPEVFPEISTSRVLIMNWVEGKALDEISSFSMEQRRRIARTGIRTALTQMLEDGLFHADPHPGNILILPDGRMCLLDWGMVGRLTPDMRGKLIALLIGMVEKDSEVVLDILLAISDVRLDKKRDRVHRDLIGVLDDYSTRLPEESSIGSLLYSITQIFRVHGVPIRPDLAAVVRALITSEASARILSPELDIITEARPFLEEILFKLYSPPALGRKLRSRLLRLIYSKHHSLERFYGIFDKLYRDRLTIRFRHEGLDHIEQTIAQLVNRLVLSLLTAALIIGSSMIITTGVKPLLFGYPLIGIVGFFISALFGAYIILKIIGKKDL